MRLHTSNLTMTDLDTALNEAQDAGLVPRHVYYETLAQFGSRSRTRAFEIKLGTDLKEKGDGRRWANSGSHGKGDVYAATYDEWGYVIARIFEKDPEATFGRYASRDDFHIQTHGAYQF